MVAFISTIYSPVWSPYLLKDIKRVESVQRRFTKRLCGMSNLSYGNRLKALNLHTLEYRRLQHDLIYVYKILFGIGSLWTTLKCSVTHYVKTRGHQWKLYPTHCHTNVRKHFFRERVIAAWNSLKITPDTVQSIATFKSLVNRSDLSGFLHLL